MELSEAILKKANEYADYTAKNLSKLIQIKSLSGEEKDVVNEVKHMMEEAGFDEVKIDGLGNAVGRIGKGKKIIAIDGHIDTVDLGNLDNWDFDPLSGEIKDGFVHGRGSVDQKGGPAAAVTAGRILKETYAYFPEGTVHVAVVDPGVGSQRKLMAFETENHFFVGPDNGLFWPILETADTGDS